MESLDRRRFLKLAGSSALSLFLRPLTASQAAARGPERPRSLIVVWMAGGPSQLETWDPHPGKIGAAGQCQTRIPSVFFADHYPQTAEQAHHVNVIRSLVSREGDHERATHYLKTGWRPDPTVQHPALPSLFAHETPRADLEIPPCIAIGGGNWPARGGYLGDEHDAYRVHDTRRPLHNMQSNVDPDRVKGRLASLEVVESAFRAERPAQARRTLHTVNTERALKMMSSRQLAAFELHRETAETRKDYGDTDIGRGCLLARRLIETGVRAVEVTVDGFDTHVNNLEQHQTIARDLDPALGSLITDLVKRDLLASTVLLVLGEFGRTPKINGLDGRDHWPTGFSCLVGGGGLAKGKLLGATDPEGEKTDPDHPIAVADLHATVLTALGLDPAKELITPVGRPLKLSDGKKIPELI